MRERRDPLQATADDDLDEIATWRCRTRLDRVATRLYRLFTPSRNVVVGLAVVLLTAQFVAYGLVTTASPTAGAFMLLSLVPAFAIAFYVWQSDVTSHEPLPAVAVTFLFGAFLSAFAVAFNPLVDPLFAEVPLVGAALFFYLFVAPLEEGVKLLAVRLYAFRRPAFDAVIDGAVYGAAAGLGFATVENALYIGQQYASVVGVATPLGVSSPFVQTVAIRTFAGPGHVVYSALAGYYLGLAKFNPDDEGPIATKGWLIAVALHGTYNVLVGVVPQAVAKWVPGASAGGGFLTVVVVYGGVVGYVLYRRIATYRRSYLDAVGKSEMRRPPR